MHTKLHQFSITKSTIYYRSRLLFVSLHVFSSVSCSRPLQLDEMSFSSVKVLGPVPMLLFEECPENMRHPNMSRFGLGRAVAPSVICPLLSCMVMLIPFIEDDTSWFNSLNSPKRAEVGTGNHIVWLISRYYQYCHIILGAKTMEH